MMIFVPFIYYRITSNSGCIFPHSCQYHHYYWQICDSRRFCILKRHYRNSIEQLVCVIMYNWFQLIRVQHSFEFHPLSVCLSLYCVSLWAYVFCFVVIAIHCVGDGSLVDTQRFYSHWICTFTCIIDMVYFLPAFLSTAIHICGDRECVQFIRSFVRWFRHFTAPLICLIHKNNTRIFV